MEKKINVGVIGGTGYTGGEMCRLLLNHDNVAEIFPTSREDLEFERVHQNLLGSGLKFIKKEDLEQKTDLDCVFFCTPSGEAMRNTQKYLDKGIKVVDLSADFRFKSAEKYEEIYGKEHQAPKLLKRAAYGITEFNREQIRNTDLVANPGCYVITTMLGLAPLIKNNIIELENIPISAINGTTGGKGVTHTDTFGSILPYNMEGHRHSSELENQISIINPEAEEVMVNFNTAHGNFTRGIYSLATPLVKAEHKPGLTREKLLQLYNEYYQNEFFVRINDFEKKSAGISKEYDVYPWIKNIRNTNFCDIGLDYDADRGIIKVVAVADNLNKGSAGSAIQNMNVMFGFNEKQALTEYAG